MGVDCACTLKQPVNNYYLKSNIELHTFDSLTNFAIHAIVPDFVTCIVVVWSG